jgi:diaminopimelate decarboxylase
MSTFFEQNPPEKLADIQTPFYYYDLRILQDTLLAIKAAIEGLPYHIHYAIKANANAQILEKVREAGLGIDCVSGEEVKAALDHGFFPEQIAFAGVGKTDEEIGLGLKHGIFSFNVESLAELKVIDELAGGAGKKARVAIRFNPNVNAKTHQYITTGLEENKFGINYWELNDLFELYQKLEHVEIQGIHFHIGSQVTDLSVFKSLCNRVNEMQQLFRERNQPLQHINVGGGLGVNYTDPDARLIPDFKAFFGLFKESIELAPEQELHFELGRAIVAQCGALISKVLFIKEGIKTNFAIIDAGMTELIRPALYQSYHKIENISKLQEAAVKKYDVVGPICESSDCFGKMVALPPTERGDLIAIRTAGAYGEVMSSAYNLRKKAKAIYHEDIL